MELQVDRHTDWEALSMKRFRYLVPAIILMRLTACSSAISLAPAHTTPAVLAPGEYEVGPQFSYSDFTSITGGGTEAEFQMPAGPLCLHGRASYMRNVDVGVRIFLYESDVTIYPDLKIKLLGSSRFLTLDVGMCIETYRDGLSVFGLSPMLLFGTDRFYSGLRYSGNEVSHIQTDVILKTIPVSLILGGSIGDQIKVLPEVQLYVGAVMVNIGIRWSLLFSHKPPD